MKYKASEKYIIREIAGEKLLLAKGAKVVDFSSVIVFNETGIFLWELLSNQCSEEELIKALAEKYGVSPEIAKNDVEKFLNKSIGEGIVITEE